MIQLGADGEERRRRAFASPMDFVGSQVAALDPKLWVGMDAKKVDAARTAAREERIQSNADREYDLRVRRQDAQDERDERRIAAATTVVGVPSREERLRYT